MYTQNQKNITKNKDYDTLTSKDYDTLTHLYSYYERSLTCYGVNGLPRFDLCHLTIPL